MKERLGTPTTIPRERSSGSLGSSWSGFSPISVLCMIWYCTNTLHICRALLAQATAANRCQLQLRLDQVSAHELAASRPQLVQRSTAKEPCHTCVGW